MLRAVSEQGYTEATPIQLQAIPVVLSGRDLLAAAQTGTGKTAGFTLPMLQRLNSHDLHRHAGTPGHHAASHSPARHPLRALILVPTRELAAQVHESVRAYGRHMKLRSAMIFGGVGMNPQIQDLRRGVDIVVATPGRLLDHVQQRTIDLRQIEILVLDEADRMLDMGFIHDIRRIIGMLPPKRQNLLFSATFSDEIRRLAGQFLHDPATVEVARRNAPIELVEQLVHPVDQSRKRELLAHLVKTNDWRQVLVFIKTKHGANRLAEQLSKDGIDADAIHGNKSQPQRMRTLKRFKDGELQVLVATDIAARGIDIDALPHVVNFDLPNVSEDYVHRIGRTGRAGETGEAISLVSGEDRPLLAAIERLIKRQIEQRVVEGFEPSAAYYTAKHVPEQRRQGQGRGQGQGQGQRQGQGQGQRQNRGQGGRGQPQGQRDGQGRGRNPEQGQGRGQEQGQGQRAGKGRGAPTGGQNRQDRPGKKRPDSRWGNSAGGKQGGGQRRPDTRFVPKRPDEAERIAQAEAARRMLREEEGQGEQGNEKRTKSGLGSAIMGLFGRKAA